MTGERVAVRRARRSWLFVPANKRSWAEPAVRSGADCIILDLEDAVASEAKGSARQTCLDLLHAISSVPHESGTPHIFVRINGLRTQWWLDDLLAICRGPVQPTGIVLPEVRTVDELTTVDTVLTTLTGAWNGSAGVELHPIFETPEAILHAEQILAASPRIRSYFGGAAPDADLASLMGYRWTAARSETLLVRSLTLLAGRAVGSIQPVGGTWLDIADIDGLVGYAEETRALGFEGMYVIHPSHVVTANAIFSPSEKEIRWAGEVMTLLDQAGHDGSAATVLNGRMIDHATRARAMSILSAAES